MPPCGMLDYTALLSRSQAGSLRIASRSILLAMPDMLVRLYDLPDPATYYRRVEEAGVAVRRAQPWERSALRAFIEGQFSGNWADESEAAFSKQPVNAFVALVEREIVGFAAYECTRRAEEGPAGVRALSSTRPAHLHPPLLAPARPRVPRPPLGA